MILLGWRKRRPNFVIFIVHEPKISYKERRRVMVKITPSEVLSSYQSHINQNIRSHMLAMVKSQRRQDESACSRHYKKCADEVLLSRANSKASVSFNREQSDDEILNILLSFQNRG